MEELREGEDGDTCPMKLAAEHGGDARTSHCDGGGTREDQRPARARELMSYQYYSWDSTS